MSTGQRLAIGGTLALAAVLAVTDLLAAMRGGGGMRGGGVRSAPSVSRPSASRPVAVRPSAPSRSVAPARSMTPISAGGSGARVSQGIQTRPSVSQPVARPGVATRPGSAATMSAVRPMNYGSISRAGATAGLAAAGGATRAARSGYGGRDIQSGHTLRGGDYVAIDGPRGEFGAIRGPGGTVAAGARGPGGEAVTGVRGPRGNWVVDRVPDGCVQVDWGAHRYWHYGHYWYAPVWYDDDWRWEYRYPPVGYWYQSLPEDNDTITVSNVTYYVSDSVYYQEGEKDGEDGFVVVPPPGADSASQALAVLQRTCDFLGGLTSFTAVVDATMDRYLETGDKVPVSGLRVIRVQQPDRMAVDLTGTAQDQRMVYADGTLTVVDRRDGRSTSFDLPSRIEDAIPDLQEKRNIQMPFGDLLQRDAFDALSIGVKSAEYVGEVKLGEADCQHAAFSQEDLDWELWVKTGDEPLPMKISVTYKTAPQRPRFTWTCLAWEVNQAQPADAFAVERPEAMPPSPSQ